MNTLADLLTQIPPREEEKRFVDKSLQLAALITAAMQRQGLTQKALAERLGKQESEVSRWLTGLHNFTLKSLTRLEVVLGEDLVLSFRDNTGQQVAHSKDSWTGLGPTWQPAPMPTGQPATAQGNYDLLQAA